jgi:hypothetical protein
VRTSLERVVSAAEVSAPLEALLEAKYRHYEGRPFAEVLVFRITGMTGWAASPENPGV